MSTYVRTRVLESSIAKGGHKFMAYPKVDYE